MSSSFAMKLKHAQTNNEQQPVTQLQDRIVEAQKAYVKPTPPAVNSYTADRNQEIRELLDASGLTDLINPSDTELSYVNSVFQNKGFHKIQNVTYEVVSNIGRTEFNNLNRELAEFTKKMGGVNTSGIFDLVDDLSKSLAVTELEEIYNKAVNAKPSLFARFLSIFDKSAGSKSLSQRYKVLQNTLNNKGKVLEDKLVEIEHGLVTQKKIQEKTISDLEKAFGIYYNAFIELRKQFALIIYLEHSYKSQLEKFKTENATSTDLLIQKELSDYENLYVDIQNKRLIIHKSMLQLPITVQQNTNLVGVCKTLLKEIDNTLVSSFPMIRGNLQTIGTSIMTQKAMLGNNNAKELERNLALTASEVTGHLAVKGATLAADLRLQEADTIQVLVSGMKSLKQQLDTAKDESQQKMDSATGILTNATNELKDLLGGK